MIAVGNIIICVKQLIQIMNSNIPLWYVLYVSQKYFEDISPCKIEYIIYENIWKTNIPLET